MPSINYLVKRLCTMNYKSMFDRINVVKKKCNKSKFMIFCDMVWCGIRYGAGYVDYDVIGFYKLNSKLNNVDKNIMIVSSSDMPNVNKGNLILASHSGNSSVSYFRYLYKLNKGDIASIYYYGKKYDYKLVNYYDVNKNGMVQIIKNNDINTLTLITCRKNTDNQIVFIFELIKEGKL